MEEDTLRRAFEACVELGEMDMQTGEEMGFGGEERARLVVDMVLGAAA